nr:hypothetical protein [Sphingomonas formosensis]
MPNQLWPPSVWNAELGTGGIPAGTDTPNPQLRDNVDLLVIVKRSALPANQPLIRRAEPALQQLHHRHDRPHLLGLEATGRVERKAALMLHPLFPFGRDAHVENGVRSRQCADRTNEVAPERNEAIGMPAIFTPAPDRIIQKLGDGVDGQTIGPCRSDLVAGLVLERWDVAQAAAAERMVQCRLHLDDALLRRRCSAFPALAVDPVAVLVFPAGDDGIGDRPRPESFQHAVVEMFRQKGISEATGLRLDVEEATEELEPGFDRPSAGLVAAMLDPIIGHRLGQAVDRLLGGSRAVNCQIMLVESIAS